MSHPCLGIVSAVPTLGWLGRRRCRKINADFCWFFLALSPLSFDTGPPNGVFLFLFRFFPQKEDEGVAGDAEDAGLEADFFQLDRPTGLGGFVF